MKKVLEDCKVRDSITLMLLAAAAGIVLYRAGKNGKSGKSSAGA